MTDLPKHAAFIVDGNRRWAEKRGLPAIAGHKKVVEETLDRLISHAVSLGIPYLTFWGFSTENWRRGKLFAKALFSLLKKGIKERAAEYTKKGYRFKVIGELAGLPEDVRKLLLSWQEKSAKNKKITVTIAINYGGRDEIVRAMQKLFSVILSEDPSNGLKPRNLAKRSLPLARSFTSFRMTKGEFEKYLDTAGMPDPDLIIRTGGECRLSGFLLWQSEYSELYFTETLFPDFDVKEFEKALKWFGERERRFGR